MSEGLIWDEKMEVLGVLIPGHSDVFHEDLEVWGEVTEKRECLPVCVS